jgi:hypothetical protein
MGQDIGAWHVSAMTRVHPHETRWIVWHLKIRQTNYRNGVTPMALFACGAGANRMPIGGGFPKKQRPGVMPRIG